MATTSIRSRPTGTMLMFRTDNGRCWVINIETLSQIFRREARETLEQWAREREEEDRSLGCSS